jgi:hypothetical protein
MPQVNMHPIVGFCHVCGKPLRGQNKQSKPKTGLCQKHYTGSRAAKRPKFCHFEDWSQRPPLVYRGGNANIVKAYAKRGLEKLKELGL